MKEVVIELDGQLIGERVDSAARFVVVSHKRDGSLRIQGTASPGRALAAAQRDGDEDLQIARIEDGHATFSPRPVSVAQQSPPPRTERPADETSLWDNPLVALALGVAILLVLIFV